MPTGSRWKVLGLVAVLLLGLEVLPNVLAQSQEYRPPHQRPGPAVDRLLFRSFHVDLAAAALQAKEMDFYAFSLKTESARQAKQNPAIQVYEAPASSISLILNPAPAPAGELNPFSLREVRFALQYAVNREFIAREIYKGLAEPMVGHVGPFDYDYLTVYRQVKEANVTYDPDFARQQITAAMTRAGAELRDGKWHFGGKPIQLKFIIRVEDERREVGDLVRGELEKLGFTVSPVYHSFAPAILTVYSTDPKLFEWHLYTEGWGRSAAERYDFGTINSMAAPWLGNMPGWQEVGFWQYEQPRLDDLGKKLFQGAFTSKEERDQLYQEMTRLALDESVRIWLATVVNSLPASREVQGVTQDIAAGPKSIWTLREAYVPGKDTLTVGNVWVWTERSTWNPIGGFGDVYSNDIWQNLHDPPLWRDPFTGVPIPFRATYQVTTAGPTGKLDVPADAVQWDASAKAFVPVPGGTRATSKVTFNYSKYFQSKWHHGQPITMADVVYPIYQAFDLAFDKNKSQVEFALAVTSRPYLQTVRGLRITGPETLEVYVDYWHFVEAYIAEYANLSGVSMPWEVLAAMDQLVFQDRRAAYSDTAAQRFGVPWISLVMDNDARLVRRTLLELQGKGSYPTNVFKVGNATLVTPEQAKERYAAAIAWVQKYGMAVISNGPFQLVRFEPPAQFVQLDAFRDPTYPFKPGSWYRGVPPVLRFERIEATGIGIGAPAIINVDVRGPGQLSVQYLLLDPLTGKLVAQGEAKRVGDSQYTIQLPEQVTSGMKAGPYQLFVTASSDQVSSLAERRVALEARAAGEVGQLIPTVVALGTPVPPGPPPARRGFGCSPSLVRVSR
ncbi:MAG: hypothetical protein HY535_03250 [Chloroflexi bacterium]|nr:hypothetical protein [Chloroflexota bacterium]